MAVHWDQLDKFTPPAARMLPLIHAYQAEQPTPSLATFPPDYSELHEQLAFKTSSSKKRKVSSRPPPLDRIDADYPSSNTAIPSCEPPDDPTFSFSASGPDTPSYVPADSQPASSLPPRLQPNGSFPTSTDYASSRESSPSTSAYADLSIDGDKGGDDTGLPASQRGGRPSVNTSWRGVMNGETGLHQRSSSPLKRRASSMDPETDSRDKENGGGSDASTEQGLPRAMSIDPPELAATDGLNGQTGNTPPIQEQVKIIETLLLATKDAPLKEGDKAYLVSRSWVDKALAWGTNSKPSKTSDPAEAATLGPVDNSDIVEEVITDSSGEEFTRLKPGSGLESFELFPEDAWNMVVEWYGLKEGQTPIVRIAINDAPDAQSKANIIYELHLPIFRIHRLWTDYSPLPIEQRLKAENPPPLVLVRSRKTGAQKFLKTAKSLAGIPLDRKVRLFAMMPKIPAGNEAATASTIAEALTPPDSPQKSNGDQSADPWGHLLLDTVPFSEVRDFRMEVPMEDQTNNEKYNGKSAIQRWELNSDQTLILDEAIDDGWVSTYTRRKAAKPLPLAKSNTSTLTSKTSSGRSSPGGQAPNTRGRALRKRPGKSLGAVGLQNLGNTCYMNSALQCVRSVEELTKYFLTESYNEEINKTNPLGYNGRVALAYAGLLGEIYNEGRGSVNPRDFKTTVGRCRSTFQGWGQQDSQEFLGFLLDGLQEDLSRVKKKPYIEKPDSTDDMIDDPEAIRKMAEQVWDITRRRDDSVIADLFTGMYKSTLKCPECGKISITFDPFNNLTLPLPVENMWVHTVKFFPLNDVPVKFDVELPKHSELELLKRFISERTGVPVERLMGAEEFKERFFKIYYNQQDISEEIQGTDHPTIHELEMVPTNWPGKGKPKKFRSMLDIDSPPSQEWDDPRYDRMVIPVFHRRAPGSGGGRDGVAPPQFITVAREEAFDYDRIRRKILERVSTLSTWSAFLDETEADSSQTMDSDTVNIPSDLDSSGDNRVAARSVEDDIVDVTMKDASDKSASQTSSSTSTPSKVLKHFNKVRPSFMDPEGFLDPRLQNLFDLSYFTDGSDGAVPTGWSQVDNNRLLPKLSDRMPQIEEENEPSPESWGSTASGNEESSNDEEQKAEISQTRMLEESSEEDESPARTGRRGPIHQRGSKKKFVDHRNRGKKFNKRREKSMRGKEEQHSATAIRPQPVPAALADGGPLIRLGEGLVVDWNDEAWNTVFGQSAFDRHGSKKLVDMETVYDQALHVAKSRRQTRKSRGITLEECLDEFERAEVLSEQDMWYCPRCKEHRRASKKFDLWKSPDILVAHLKRFSSSGYRRDKLDVLVDFPIENLDLTSRVIEKEDGRDEIYDLIAVDDHYGGLGGGHYTAYAKNFVDGRWYSYNDSSVSPVPDPSVVVTPAAYLLFYRRRAKTPLGGPRFTEINRKFDGHDESVESSDTEIGDDDQPNGVYYRNNRLSIEGKPAAFRPRGARDTGATTTITPLTNSDGDEEDELPSYNTIQPSVEDEGVEMADNDHLMEPNPVAQRWSFSGLGGNAHDNSAADDTASDRVQVDSTDDEHGASQSRDGDVEMNFVTTGLSDTEDGLIADGRRGDSHKEVVPLVTKNYDSGLDEVTEIHVDGDKN